MVTVCQQPSRYLNLYTSPELGFCYTHFTDKCSRSLNDRPKVMEVERVQLRIEGNG